MTTYQVTSDGNGHQLVASWPDLPERVNRPVATFKELKLATAAKSVLNAASRYRWHRRIQLLDEGIFTDEQAGPDPIERPATARLSPGSSDASGQPPWLPRLPTSVVLGDSPMSDHLQARIESLLPVSGPQVAPAEPDSAGFTDRVPIGNLRPLLWKDWHGHLQTDEHGRLTSELDADLAATTGSLTDRGRQIAWYLSAELLIDEDQSRLTLKDEGGGGEERLKAFQKSLVQLLSDLIGLRVESTAVDWDPDNEELLRVYSPKTVVGFWLDPECWYNGWPDTASPDSQTTIWQHAGTLPTDTSIGDLASYIMERLADGTWPFGGNAPGERRSLFGGRRRGIQ
jgi:hypothetical protein